MKTYHIFAEVGIFYLLKLNLARNRERLRVLKRKGEAFVRQWDLKQATYKKLNDPVSP